MRNSPCLASRRVYHTLIAMTCIAAATITPAAEIHLRWNQAGYRPDRSKVLLAMSEEDLAGREWRIERGDDTPALTGTFATSVTGAGDHTPLPFNHAVDFSALTAPGRYRFITRDVAPATIVIAPDPYAALRSLPLRHLRVMRSGSDDVLLRKPSHPGDAHAPLWVPDGDPENGKWKPADPARSVDVLGGWYDAGDQIKFTLNIAYTTYHLLFAYRLAPEHFTAVHSRSGLPDVLDEARHGLEFLLRVHPDADTFIIQVGDERDHDQPLRLPENDALDGQRPALAALARAQMGSAAAALALGARTWRELGHEAEAARYAAMAAAIYARAREPDTIVSAFERGAVNDFYRDATDADQMALAAVELHALTGDGGFLEQAIAHAPPAAGEVSWGAWNWLANAGLAPHDAAARDRLTTETRGYTEHAANSGQPWSLPGRYVWASLHRWIGAANGARYANRVTDALPERDALFHAVLDYIFGRNNWGVSFLFAEELPNTVRNIYSPAYHLLGAFPTGALSEGPGNRTTHDSLRKYFSPPADDPLARFNTPAAVFSDNASDFMCQEATISGQADIVLMLTLATGRGASPPIATTARPVAAQPQPRKAEVGSR